MPRWLLLALLVVVYIAVGSGCTTEKAAREQPRPQTKVDPAQLPMKYRDHSVVLISIDALQAKHVGCLGNKRNVTPHLDAFARESFVFSQFHSVSSWTVPASMTWFTGMYPSEHRLTNKFAVYNAEEQRPARLSQLAPNLITLAEVLKANGYQTAGFTGNAGVSGAFGFAQGFDVYDHEPRKFGSLSRSGVKAAEWLKEHSNEKFFLFLHGYDVHGQFGPAGGYDYRFVDRNYDRRFTGSPPEQELLREEGLEKGSVDLRSEDVEFWRAIYDEKVQRADEQLGKFLHELAALQLNPPPLVIITADHGTELHEHRRFDHGFTLYEELVHVPLFVQLPGQQASKPVSARLSSIDVMPTVLDLLEVSLPERAKNQLRGQSLLPAMRGEPSEREIFAETDYRQYTYQRSITTPAGWKLIFRLEAGTRELYHLQEDPGELHNRAADDSPTADELQEKLFAHFAALGHDLTAQRWTTGLNPVYDSQGRVKP
ncbi:sulfatase [Anatilimnocola sp. NA78]|uniref:sulfatase n=1 Tax=Anatilimnocola sp. NA78 TaxID=3415683 RepID=UPI003CE533A8